MNMYRKSRKSKNNNTDAEMTSVKSVTEKFSAKSREQSAVSNTIPSTEMPWEDYEEHTLSSALLKSADPLSRTSLLLLDYRHFKAARTIQTAFRGWYVRHVLAKKRNAAKIIQTEWRRFHAKRFYYCFLENTLQLKIEKYHFRAAQIIQALWRGWWVRENVHDHYQLTRMQVRAAKDLLHCVAYKLHYLLRTHQIPGIYSLRNTHCLSKVEQLLNNLSFKKHNDRMRLARLRREAQLNDAKKNFKDALLSTKVPYPGPNFQGYCEPKCCKLYSEADADRKMYAIISLYERNAVEQRFPKAKPKPSYSKSVKAKPDFCSDVLDSMRRWNILNTKNLNIDANIFRKPENLEQFLTEIESVYSLMQKQCHCRTKMEDITKCRK